MKIAAVVSLIWISLLLASVLNRGAVPFCHVLTLYSDQGLFEYWVSPFITNGNRVTHICANLIHPESQDGKWGVEIPRKGKTLEIFTLDKETALNVIQSQCHKGI